MKQRKANLNEVVKDAHPRVIVNLKSLSRQNRSEEQDRKDLRLYGRCGSVSICGPEKVVKGFAEYVDVNVDDIFDEPREYSKVEDSTDMILEHLLKIRLLAREIGASPGYLKLLEILEKSTEGIRKVQGR